MRLVLAAALASLAVACSSSVSDPAGGGAAAVSEDLPTCLTPLETETKDLGAGGPDMVQGSACIAKTGAACPSLEAARPKLPSAGCYPVTKADAACEPSDDAQCCYNVTADEVCDSTPGP